ncbi:HNH endonuclease [Pseudooceanicola nanhaiensis]|uniref:HNH endonuclease n=1 Tax=Pseudooceanicola nanhaiensis TaxID=375761 RepID=UPI001CD19C67|nr:HNH endonuclease [Pseudooceanicola nanhaiensis]MCA0919280.1 HNH endonuclease [Pseudooceanicola nanhaiensis]
MGLSDIDRVAVLRATEEFDRLGRDAFLQKHGFGRSRSYHLQYGGKLYDSKAIIGVAHGYTGAGRRPLEASDFSGGEATVARTLRDLDFEVQTPAIPNTVAAASNVSPEGFAFWWVNNKQTYAHEIGGNYLWSPTEKSNGGRNEFYENMKRVRPGDVVFAFAGGEIRAIGVCSAPAILAPKPGEFGSAGEAWGNEGWRLPVEFIRLSQPLRPKDHISVLATTLPEKYSPLQSNGNGNQGAYLAAVPFDMAQVVINLLGARWAELDRAATIEPTRQTEAIESSEKEVERALLNRTDLDETERLQLVKSRRGQGIYRQNLEGFEKACRITGVKERRHLRASHIKPWRISTTFEKLDGNNGLLLSPHIDHLFDQGFLSFTDNGDLLVSQHLDVDTLIGWGIDSEGNYGSFRLEQLPYLEFHRENIFRR